MKTRVVNALWLWFTIAAIFIFIDIQAVVWIFSLVVLATQYELYSLLKRAGFPSHCFLGIALGFFILFMAYYYPGLVINGFHVHTGILTIIIVLVCLINAFFQKSTERNMDKLMTTLLGILYVPYLLQYLILIIPEMDDTTHSKAMGFWIIFVVKMSDVGGLLVGKLCGKRKLAPHISPHKTWEGLAGSFFFAAFTGGIIVWVLGDSFPESFTLIQACMIAILITPFCILGDLVQSSIKRQANVKDSNNFIPGIGGIFDMMDSLILSIPVAYMLIRLLL